MFTGIVQCMGLATDVRVHEGGMRLRLESPQIAARARPGDSICVSGVCLTVAKKDEKALEFDIIRETLDKSTLGRIAAGGFLNLEPSLRVGDRLDGHFVQGHVDGTASVDRVIASEAEHVVWLRPQRHLLPFIAPKGSVAIDGVSMTIAALDDDRFSIALIPTTLEVTTLGRLRPGDKVNIESDIMARIVIQHLCRLLGAGSDATAHPLALRDLLSKSLLQVVG